MSNDVRRTTRRRGERGAELIEFAIAFPLLFLLVAAIVDFGFMFRSWEAVTNAAREGARLSVLNGYSTTDVQNRVMSYLAVSGLKKTAPAVVVTVTPGTVTLASGAVISVKTVSVHYPWPFPFIGQAAQLIGASWGSISLKANASMRVELPSS